MKVRRHCLCLLSLVLSVKPEVESVFKEKTASGDGLIGGRMKTRRWRRLFLLNISKTSPSVQPQG